MNCLHLFHAAVLGGLLLTQHAIAQESPANPGSPPPMTQPKGGESKPRRPKVEAAQEQRRRAAADALVPQNIQLIRDVVYAQAPGDDGKPIDLKFDAAFLKESDGKPMPAVIYIHGGGWEGGSKEGGLRQIVGMAMGGYFAVTIDYRLSGQAKYPAGVHDCKAAIRFIRANAEKLGVDPNRIGVMGHSAGGHLAALMGTSGDAEAVEGKVGTTGVSSKVQCVADMSGPVDLHFDAANGVIGKWFGGPVREHEDLAKQASPLTYIDASDPPVLIVHGMQDEIVNIRQAKMFEKALKEAGVQEETLFVEGAGHMIEQPDVMIRVAEFFDTNLHAHAAPAIREFIAQRSAGSRVNGDNEPATSPGIPTRPAATAPQH